MRINPPIAWLVLLTLASGSGPASVSPDGAQPAFVFFRKTLTTNVWLLNLKTPKLVNLTAFLGFVAWLLTCLKSPLFTIVYKSTYRT